MASPRCLELARRSLARKPFPERLLDKVTGGQLPVGGEGLDLLDHGAGHVHAYARGKPMRSDDDTELMRHTVIPYGRTSPARGRSHGPGDRLTCGRPGICVLVALLLMPAVVRAQTMRWPEAVAALAAERTRAETCVQLLKRHAGDNAVALSRGQLAYGEAKAEMDAVIAGLTIVLGQRGTPPDLADLEARLTRGVQAREAFCTQVSTLLPEDPGTKDLLIPLLGIFLPPLLEAARSLYTGQTEQDRLLRQTIQTQLEATQWARFAAITP